MTVRSQSPFGASDRDRRNGLAIVVWSLTWMVLLVGVDVALGREWITSRPIVIAAIAAVALVGIGWLLAYRRFLHDTDELMRKIQLDALAWTAGIAVVASFAYGLLAEAGIFEETSLSDVTVVMAATYIISVLAGLRRYS